MHLRTDSMTVETCFNEYILKWHDSNTPVMSVAWRTEETHRYLASNNYGLAFLWITALLNFQSACSLSPYNVSGSQIFPLWCLSPDEEQWSLVTKCFWVQHFKVKRNYRYKLRRKWKKAYLTNRIQSNCVHNVGSSAVTRFFKYHLH
jgi:hypothetical protein